MYGEASREIRSALEQAKAILLDTSKRAAYDRWLEERRRTTEPSRPSPLEQIELMLDVLIRDDSITASEKTRLLTKAEELGISVRDVEALLRRRGVRTISDAERAEAERRRWEREEAERRTREEAERRRRTEQVLLHWFSLCEGCISLTLYPFTPFGLAFYEGGAAGARPPAPFRREGAIENFYNVMVDKPVKGL